MLHAVFNQQLKHELRHQQIARLRLNVPAHSHTASQPHALNIQIVFGKTEFVRQRHQVRAVLLQRAPQQAGKPQNHLLCPPRVAVHQRRDAIQRIEQEVGLYLHL